MFIGHGVLAFVLAAVLAVRLDQERPLLLGGVAGVFATIPDVDMAYAVLGLLEAVSSGTGTATGLATAFWSTGNVVHRSVTHSLIIGTAAAGMVWCWTGFRRNTTGSHRLIAAVGATTLTAAVLATGIAASGPLSGAVLVAFLGGAVLVAEATTRLTDLSPVTIAALALGGFVTHPFGDLFTGQPPRLLYPIETTVFTERVSLAADPTIHLLGAFGIELALIWAGVLVWLWLTGRSVSPAVNRRALTGTGFAGAVLVLPAPTLELSYPFVFGVLAVGLVGALPRIVEPRGPRVELPAPERAVLTGLAAVTVALGAYTLAYLAVM